MGKYTSNYWNSLLQAGKARPNTTGMDFLVPIVNHSGTICEQKGQKRSSFAFPEQNSRIVGFLIWKGNMWTWISINEGLGEKQQL